MDQIAVAVMAAISIRNSGSEKRGFTMLSQCKSAAWKSENMRAPECDFPHRQGAQASELRVGN
jgi:hypothetical protein